MKKETNMERSLRSKTSFATSLTLMSDHGYNSTDINNEWGWYQENKLK